MLTALRKQAKSWVVKAFLLLLVASFAIWGIGDIFYSSPTEETVASVGSADITGAELNNAFNRSLANMQRQFGGRLDREQAIGLGLMDQTLQEQIMQRVVSLEAADMGISIDDDTLRRLITENPAFQTAGRFDRLRFDQILYTTGMSEQAYLEALRQELASNALTASIAAAAVVPDVQVDTIYRYRNEERRGRFIKIADASIDALETPDDAALEALHQENEERFTAPELRSVTYVTLEPKDLIEEVEIADEDVRIAYDERAAQYVTPERRTVQQLLAPDEDKVAEAQALIEEGEDFAAIADQLDGVSFTDLGDVTENGMPAGIGGEAFTINEGEVTDPAESPFGLHLFKVTAITPEEVTSFEEVEGDLRNELALFEAEDRLPSFATQLDDELAAGLSVREAAGALGLTAQTVDLVDRQGRGEDGQPIAALDGWSALLQTAFEAGKGEPSLLEETDEGAYYVVEVDEITEPRLKPVEEVRDDLIALFEEQKRREGAKAKAEDIIAKLQEAASLETIAAEDDLQVEVIEPLTRAANGAGTGLNRVAIQALFTTDEGAVADEVIEVEDGVLVVAVDEIIGKTAGDDPEGRDQLKTELERQLRSDMLDQYGVALQDIHAIQIDEAALQRLINYDPTLHGYGGGGMAPGGMF